MTRLVTIAHLISSMTNASAPNGIPTSNFQSVAIIFIVIALLLVMRVYRNINGRIYRDSRVFRTPLIYGLLLLFFVGYLEYSHPIFFLTLLFVPIGFMIGIRFDFQPNFFYRNNILYYKRSPAVLVIWLVAFIIRLALDLFYSTNLYANLSVDSLLALTTGIIVSEALTLLRGKRKFLAEHPHPDNEPNDIIANSDNGFNRSMR